MAVNKTVMFTQLCGRLNQDKYLPLRHCPLTLEFEVVGNFGDAVVSSYTSNGRSETWEITDVQVKADVVQLDNALDNEYAQHLLSGKKSSNQFYQLC